MNGHCRTRCRALKDFSFYEYGTSYKERKEVKKGDFINLLQTDYRRYLSVKAVVEYKLEGVHDERRDLECV